MLTYNSFLYQERMNRGLSRRKMAKAIGVPLFKYSMIEKGYFKPSKKVASKISSYFNIDYSIYLKNEPSYPAELPEKEKLPIFKLFYKVMGSLPLKIIFIVLSILSVGYMISGFVTENHYENNLKNYYETEFQEFYSHLQENGSYHFSVTGDMVSPEYYHYEKIDEHTSEYISIVGSYNEKNYGKLSYQAIYRYEEGRLLYQITPSYRNNIYTYNVTASYEIYEEVNKLSGSFYMGDDNSSLFISVINSKGDREFIEQNDPKFSTYCTKLRQKENEVIEDFNNLLLEKDSSFASGEPNKLEALGKYQLSASSKMSGVSIYSIIAKYLGIVLSGFNIFVVIFAFLYGARKGQLVDYRPAQLEVPVDDIKRTKTDIRISPFIPETLLEFIGIFLVFIGSFRVVEYVNGFLSGSLGTMMSQGTANQYMQTFMIGMFLLYFIDFDIFLDDKRVFRNIFLYFIVYICLYALELLVYRAINNGSIMGSLLSFVQLPNMFGSIACYYLIMMFLFYTPKFIKSKKWLIVYRCLSILPVAIIITSWFLYSGYNVLFDADWPIEVRTLFNGEKIPFSVLAILYLFGLFFLRLFFEHKYGKEKATIFFNGNRFIWIKNIMVSLIVLAIGIFELSVQNNVTLNKMGMGLYWNILFLIPLFLFYHPHKGPRNRLVDYITLGLYILSISIAYFVVVVLVIINL